MSKPTTLRPSFSLVLYVVVAVMSVIALAYCLVIPEARDSFAKVAPIPLLMLGCGWVLLAAPKLVISSEAVTVHNPLVTTRVPLGRIDEIETRHGFVMHTSEGKVQAWAAPPPDRLRSMRHFEQKLTRGDGFQDPRIARDKFGQLPSSAAPGTLSGDAAITVRHHAADASTEPITRRVNVVNIVVLVVTAVGIALTLVLG